MGGDVNTGAPLLHCIDLRQVLLLCKPVLRLVYLDPLK